MHEDARTMRDAVHEAGHIRETRLARETVLSELTRETMLPVRLIRGVSRCVKRPDPCV
jgi:hypothetical protein